MNDSIAILFLFVLVTGIALVDMTQADQIDGLTTKLETVTTKLEQLEKNNETRN